MKYMQGNIWDIQCDALCIPTNGIVKSNGEAVMGKGLALQAKTKYPDVAEWLGKRLKATDNIVRVYLLSVPAMIMVPTKHHWAEKSDMALIEKSLNQLVTLVNDFNFQKILITPLGCGNGQLSWDKVRPLMEEYLDDRFICITSQ